MLNWPLNAPHRVDNLGTVNISMTVGYENEEIRRTRIVNLANGLLRNRFGYTPKSRALKGPSFWGKAVMQKALRNTPWVKRERQARNVDRIPARPRRIRSRWSIFPGLREGAGRDARDDTDERSSTARGATAARRRLRHSRSSSNDWNTMQATGTLPIVTGIRRSSSTGRWLAAWYARSPRSRYRAADGNDPGYGDRRTGHAVAVDHGGSRTASASSNSPTRTDRLQRAAAGPGGAARTRRRLCVLARAPAALRRCRAAPISFACEKMPFRLAGQAQSASTAG